MLNWMKSILGINISPNANDRYYAAFACVSCDSSLTWHEIRGSHGVCPYCGHVSQDFDLEYKKIAKKVK